MTAIVLSPSEVRRLLPMNVCIDLMAEALQTLARDEGLNPLRNGMLLPERKGILGMMPGYTRSPEALGLKVVTVFPGNHGTDYDSHQGVVILFETEHGTPAAILDASEVTAIRTAAATGVATRILAREDAGDLAILGAGVQARTHLEAMSAVRDLRRVRVFSPNPDSREGFAAAESKRTGLAVEAAPSAEAAVRDADLICTVTSSRAPVLHADWVAPGAHINAVGSSIKTTRELDTETVVRSRLFVDRRESTINEAGDYLFPLNEGAITESHIVGEIGDILLGKIPGRESAEEVTLFKSLGLAVEDLVAADYVARAARKAHVGVEVDLGGKRYVDD